MRPGKRWGAVVETSDPAVLAGRLPAELRDLGRWHTENGLYDMHADVRAWLTARRVDPNLAIGVLTAAGFIPADWFRWWLGSSR